MLIRARDVTPWCGVDVLQQAQEEHISDDTDDLHDVNAHGEPLRNVGYEQAVVAAGDEHGDAIRVLEEGDDGVGVACKLNIKAALLDVLMRH